MATVKQLTKFMYYYSTERGCDNITPSKQTQTAAFSAKTHFFLSCFEFRQQDNFLP